MFQYDDEIWFEGCICNIWVSPNGWLGPSRKGPSAANGRENLINVKQRLWDSFILSPPGTPYYVPHKPRVRCHAPWAPRTQVPQQLSMPLAHGRRFCGSRHARTALGCAQHAWRASGHSTQMLAMGEDHTVALWSLFPSDCAHRSPHQGPGSQGWQL